MGANKIYLIALCAFQLFCFQRIWNPNKSLHPWNKYGKWWMDLIRELPQGRLKWGCGVFVKIKWGPTRTINHFGLQRGGGRKGFVLIYQVVHINIWWYDHSWGGALEIYLTFNRWPRINSSISKHLNPLHPIIMVDNSLKRTSNVLHIASVACTAMYTHILSAVIYHTLYTITLLFSVQYVSCLSMMPIQIFVHMLA